MKRIVNGIEVDVPEQERINIETEWASNLASAEQVAYIEKRVREYLSPQEQLEIMFEQGMDAWREHVKAVREKYPNPTGDDSLPADPIVIKP